MADISLNTEPQAPAELVSITIHEGKGLSAGLFGRKDPYVIGVLGNEKFHTTAISNAGKNPVWEQTFALPYYGDRMLSLSVMDKDRTLRDDLMGTTTMDLICLRNVPSIESCLPIEKKGKPAGTIRVTVALHGNSPQPPQYWNNNPYNGGASFGPR